MQGIQGRNELLARAGDEPLAFQGEMACGMEHVGPDDFGPGVNGDNIALLDRIRDGGGGRIGDVEDIASGRGGME